MAEKQIEELRDDITELKDLLNQHAKRENVKMLLGAWIEKLETNMDKL